jgi:hypothetical protein
VGKENRRDSTQRTLREEHREHGEEEPRRRE